MSRKRKNEETFIMLSRGLLDSEAYKQLAPHAAKLLPLMMARIRWSPDDPGYSDPFTFTYKEAEEYGLSRSTFFRSCKALVDVDFISRVTQGGLRGDRKVPNSYRLSTGLKELAPRRIKAPSAGRAVSLGPVANAPSDDATREVA